MSVIAHAPSRPLLLIGAPGGRALPWIPKGEK